jgi:hypothetical protein
MMNFLSPIHLINAGAMNQNIISLPFDIKLLDNIGCQMQWTGTPTGTLTFECSLDYIQNQIGAQNTMTAGNWTAITFSPSLTQPAGSAGVVLANVNQLAFPWARVQYVVTGAGVFTLALVPDVAKSLASKYFLLSDGSGNNYAVWFKVSGTGAAPAVTGYTNVEQDITTGDTAATIGGLLSTTLAALNTSGSFTVTGTSTLTITNKVAGPWTLPSAGTSGFTATVTAGTGVLDVFVAGKGI